MSEHDECPVCGSATACMARGELGHCPMEEAPSDDLHLTVGDFMTPMKMSDAEMQGVRRVMARIQRDDEAEDQGHCGEGRVERAQRDADHRRRMAALSVLRELTGVER